MLKLQYKQGNTSEVRQVLLADIEYRWKIAIEAKFGNKNEELFPQNSQPAMRELAILLKKKTPKEVFDILGQLSVSELPNVENCSWFIEYYILTEFQELMLQQYYDFLATIAASCSEFGNSSIVKVLSNIIK